MQGPHIPSGHPCLSFQLPYLIDGPHKITQSNAILRYLGRKHNLCGETEEEKIRVDILENQAMDVSNELARVCYSPDFVSLILLPCWAGPGSVRVRSQLFQIPTCTGLIYLLIFLATYPPGCVLCYHQQSSEH